MLKYLIGIMLATSIACQHHQRGFVVPDIKSFSKSATPWTSLDVKQSEGDFHFVVVTDRTGGAREGVFEEALKKINLLRPKFVMSVGDLIQGYTTDENKIESEWQQMESFTDILKMPFFYVPGNHDIMNLQSDMAWKKRFGRSFYHFRYDDILFVVLNSELLDINPKGGDYTMGKGHSQWHGSDRRKTDRLKQFQYLERVLGENANVRWTFVFLHKPLWRSAYVLPPRHKDPNNKENYGYDISNYPSKPPFPTIMEETEDWPKVQKMLSSRNYTVFAGHRHVYAYEDHSDDQYHRHLISLATTGGISHLRGLTYGEFDHIVWVTVTSKGPVVANILLDGIHPRDLKTPDASPWWIK